MSRMNPLKFILPAVLALAAFAQTPDPWAASDLMEPAALAKRIGTRDVPMILYVGFPNLYKSGHIPGSILVGPGAKPEGIELMKAALANVSHDKEIVIICGCCPMDRCPNIRPTFKLAHDMGFKNVKLVPMPTNMHTDWVTKNYPFEHAANTPPKP
ncbi:MAG: rhodanese-like domain-containing protein [Bryobacteraceae bacterium]